MAGGKVLGAVLVLGAVTGIVVAVSRVGSKPAPTPPPTPTWQKLEVLNQGVDVAPPPGWQKLAVLNQGVDVAPPPGWQKLDQSQGSITLPIAAVWQKLDSQNIPVALNQPPSITLSSPYLGGNAALKGPNLVTNGTSSGGQLEYAYTGFRPNSQVMLQIQNGASFSTMADASGSGSGTIPVNIPNGIYILIASDSYGDQSAVQFFIGTQTVQVLNTPAPGEAIQYHISGFPPNVKLMVYVELPIFQDISGQGNTSDANGEATGSYNIYLQPGNYSLSVTGTGIPGGYGRFTVKQP